MNLNDPNEKPTETPRAAHGLLFAGEHAVAFYTFLAILLKMKKDLGLEAMLEYMATYLKTIESHNPKVALAVGKALAALPVDIIFNELIKNDQGK